jgi:methylated-DNA-protein-cysteine methyltransferase related protein
MPDAIKKDAHLYPRIYSLVRQIPSGRVASYGQIAKIVGCTAREVGYAMAAAKGVDVPWQRVINSQGKISLPEDAGGALQRRLLEKEGVEFDDRDRVSFDTYGWLGLEFGTS